MGFLHFNPSLCDLCSKCVYECPFGALSMGEKGVEADAGCRMCGICVKICPQKAIRFEQKANSANKSEWKNILVYAELDGEKIHPIVPELIGAANKLAEKSGYEVNALMIGGNVKTAAILARYGVKSVYLYEHEEFMTFRPDCYTNAAADCIADMRPSVVLIGATPLGRSLAPRLSTRFHTGLTADCTALDILDNTDLVQTRPAFGGNIMAEILIPHSRPQFATVRYKVMDTAPALKANACKIINRPVTDNIIKSATEVLERQPIPGAKSIEEEEVLVVAGRGVKGKSGLALLEELAESLGGKIAFTRPMVEDGHGDPSRQIGLSGRTVKPRLIITCGVSGAIQFASAMKNAECIVAINSDPEALIFNIANYCIVDDLYQVVPRLLRRLTEKKDEV